MKITNEKLDIERILYTPKQIAGRVDEIARTLTERYGGERPVMACVLKGASFFYIDLCRSMRSHIEMDFISVSSYGSKSKSSGVVRLIKDLDTNIEGKHVILVEDIIDSGLTLKYLIELFSSRKPASITTVSFLKKTDCGKQAAQADIFGFEIPNEFVVGYGLDYAGYYRNLPYIGVLKPECYSE